jgi:hypothetical protein
MISGVKVVLKKALLALTMFLTLTVNAQFYSKDKFYPPDLVLYYWGFQAIHYLTIT